MRDDEHGAFPFFLQLNRGLLPTPALPYDPHCFAHKMTRATIESGGHTRHRGGLDGQHSSSSATHRHGCISPVGTLLFVMIMLLGYVVYWGYIWFLVVIERGGN